MKALGTCVFRVDASYDMGNGHVVRCITLAETLRVRGAHAVFLCRQLPGHLIGLIRDRGFDVLELPVGVASTNAGGPPHADWLGTSWQIDADQCIAAIDTLPCTPDWLVVDHYALDARWEQRVRDACGASLVIDDLADRPHVCDLLLDQNLGRDNSTYVDRTPAGCRWLLGPFYALIRPEFAALRESSLAAREGREPRHVLVSMGGVDQFNATGQVLDALRAAALAPGCKVDVVMGRNALWLDAVVRTAQAMPMPVQVHVDVPDMARRMAQADIAIGAGGTTVWERCCMGLPSLMFVLAQNQWSGAEAISTTCAQHVVGSAADIVEKLPAAFDVAFTLERLARMSQVTRQITDGLGAARVVQAMESCHA